MSAIFSLEFVPTVSVEQVREVVSPKWRGGYFEVCPFGDRIALHLGWYTGHENQKQAVREIVQELKAIARLGELYYFRRADENLAWAKVELGSELRLDDIFQPENEPTMDWVPLRKHRIL